MFNNGAGHSTTVVASQDDVIWTAWCGPCNPAGFARGISTNAGGTWRQLSLPANFPNRYISGLAVDPVDPTGATVYIGFNGFSRRWVEGPGAGLGHLWKTTNGGATWTDVSGNLPDVPVNDVLLVGSKIRGHRPRRRRVREWRRNLVTARRQPAVYDDAGHPSRTGRSDLRRDARPRDLVDREAIGRSTLSRRTH